MSIVCTDQAVFKPGAQESCAFSSAGVAFTLLPDQFARTKRFIQYSGIPQFAGACRATKAPSKSELPLDFMGRLGREPSEKGCLRYAANVQSITGCCGDYDGPRYGASALTIEIAQAVLQGAQLDAVISETPSSVPGAERFRIWCPASGEYTDALRETLALWVARLNGLLNGQLAPESFRLSQSFFVGGITGKPAPRVVVTRGTRIDLRTDLDEGAIYQNGTSDPPTYDDIDGIDIPEDLVESDDDPELLREGSRRKAGFLRREKRTGTPTATGDRAWRLGMWLADMRTSDGMILSPRGIKTILGDDFPTTTCGAIRGMLTQRRKPRGWDEI